MAVALPPKDIRRSWSEHTRDDAFVAERLWLITSCHSTRGGNASSVFRMSASEYPCRSHSSSLRNSGSTIHICRCTPGSDPALTPAAAAAAELEAATPAAPAAAGRLALPRLSDEGLPARDGRWWSASA